MRAPRTRLLSWGFTGPTLLFLLAFNIYPLVWNVVLGFRSGTLLGGAGASNGGANYARVFADPQFVEALRLTARFVGLAVAVSVGTYLDWAATRKSDGPVLQRKRRGISSVV